MSLLGALGGLGGCGPKKETAAPSAEVTCPEGQHFDGTYCVLDHSLAAETSSGTGGGPSGGAASSGGTPSGGAAPQNVGGSSSSGGLGVVGGAPGASGGAQAAAGPSLAVPVDITMAQAAGSWIQLVAATHLPPGAAPFGAPFAGQFQQGQALPVRLQLTQGRCYTVLAAGPFAIQELRIGIFPVDPAHPQAWLTPALLEEHEVGNQVVLGRKAECFRPTPEQTDVWLVLFVDRGQGVAGAQIFQK